MTKTFIWDSYVSQEFDDTFESQDSPCDSIYSFSKFESTTFLMDAPGRTLNLKQNLPAERIDWHASPETKATTITVNSGMIDFDLMNRTKVLNVRNSEGRKSLTMNGGYLSLRNGEILLSNSGVISLSTKSQFNIIDFDDVSFVGSKFQMNDNCVSNIVTRRTASLGDLDLYRSVFNITTITSNINYCDFTIIESDVTIETSDIVFVGRIDRYIKIAITDSNFKIGSKSSFFSNVEFALSNTSTLNIAGQNDEDFCEGANFRFNFAKGNGSEPNASTILFTNGSAFLANRLGMYGLICIDGVPQTGNNWQRNIYWEMTSDRVLIVKLR
ncbi:hypothetical protein [Brucella pituitosa]|uniref:Uncharacterized protein n=1 Tax=Brucella pituitosa TaxID=571256 RepID=A0ABS3JVM7_9HYPH|nr:hypothetical protein [Brucella pituitosa]MBO1038726.1 hypothetical protein [Brucella pituitosa]